MQLRHGDNLGNRVLHKHKCIQITAQTSQTFTVPFSFLLPLGPVLPKALAGLSTVEIHGDAFVFGGYLGSSNYNYAIYKLTCSSGSCSWSTLNQELKVRRDNSVAIHVPDTFCV